MKKQALTLGTAALLSTGITASVNADTQHVVKKGDTLSELALNYNTTVDELKSLNNLSSDLILIDQKLVVDKEEEVSEDVKYHDIVKGDTLFLIGKQYGKTVQQLKAWNNLDSDLIIAGEKLIVDKKADEEVAPKQEVKSNAQQSTQKKQVAVSVPQNNNTNKQQAAQQRAAEQQAAQQRAAEQQAAQQRAAEQQAAQQRAAEQRAAEQRAAEQRAAEQRAAEQRAAEQRAAQQKQQTQTQQVSNGRTIRVQATHYTAGCAGCSGITATGLDVRNSIYAGGKRVIAVDPRVIPLGSTVKVTTPYGSFTAIAGDTGGAIKGNIIDILVGSKGEAYSKGRTSATVTILN